MFWQSLSHDEIKGIVFQALSTNTTYRNTPILGIPASYLDEEEFYPDAPFLRDAPFMKAMVENPNHIGCHTLDEATHLEVFAGTQAIERELIALMAEQIFQGAPHEQDGYVATGGTEANIEAMWIYRNYFQHHYQAKPQEIAVVYSEDSHYSMPKGANILGVRSIIARVDDNTRAIIKSDLQQKLQDALEEGIKYFVLIANLSTTMFGSVDDIDTLTEYLEARQIPYKLHIDAAFGGFIYPFTNPNSEAHSFKNPRVTSIATDGHKMLQTPYGTGIFLIRKGYMEYVRTEEAQYIPGKDYTICGSRSGANAIAIWMLLKRHGSDGLIVKMRQLNERTTRLCSRLEALGIRYFRNPFINIVTIRAEDLPADIAEKYHLVADSYEFAPRWWKIVVMSHVKQGMLDAFLADVEARCGAVLPA